MERMDTSDDDDFRAKSDAFVNWLQHRGATISNKIQLADLRAQNAGRGVVATEDLAEDEELFSIPRSSILTLETTTIPENIRKEILKGNDDPWLSLIVGMVLEYLKGSDSPWKPYFDILPENFDTLMFWNDTELEYLEGSTVVNKIGKDGADSTFEEQLIPTIAQIAASLQLSNARSTPELMALCHRMGSTIMAYAFDLEKPSDQTKNEEDGWEEDEEEQEILPKGMVPMADMLNADADRNNAKLFYEDDKVVMKVIKPVKSGEELFNDFGNLPRADLLRRYGYVTDKYAKYDVVEIPSDMIKEQAQNQLKLPTKELNERWKYLDQQGVIDDGYDVSRAGSEEGQFSDELCVLLNALAAPKADFEKLMKKDKLPNTDLAAEAKAFLRSVLVHRYAMYRTPTEPAPSVENKLHFDMAVQVIEGEKQVLREAIERLTPASKHLKKRAADTLEDEAADIRKPTKK
ncbi:Ribosomal lysine N-methyltransferase 4 [Lecanosticta acicola]|uniref:Ribosomal lysine N-methyltransferase 4 n=1 Tax=Lecanosticta acicola TaxID=111012 RepID=A0AAI8Z1W9_9PEZI|nr:Ribosomal lysine N-methyltransferase 4 [Lecanosticta acicola]